MHEVTGEQDFIPFRYQGQYEDIEIGLYYNRFRYYDPAQGNYTQQDPIGLAGGNPTLYGYVNNPNLWIDSLRLVNWGNLLIKAGIDKPKGLIAAHGHHIVFKGDFARDKQGPVDKVLQSKLSGGKIIVYWEESF